MDGIRVPKIRGDCENGLRPCPWLRCEHHMFWVKHNLTSMNGKREKPGNVYAVTEKKILDKMTDEEIMEEIFSMKETCVLDVAGRGETTLEELGLILGLTRERIRQVEGFKGGGALRRLKTGKKRKMLEGYRGVYNEEWRDWDSLHRIYGAE